MPKSRLPKEVWDEVRKIVWKRDSKKCVKCKVSISLDKCHIDHVRSGKLAGNKLKELRTLCRYCHTLRADIRHRGLISKAIRDGVIPPDWRPLVWEEL